MALGRVPRSSLFYFALVVCLALVFYLVLQSFNSTTGTWSQSKLFAEAKAGQVREVEVGSNGVTAVDANGHSHSVHVSATTVAVEQLAKDGANVVIVNPQSNGDQLLLLLLPSLILLVLIAGFMYYMFRQARNRNPTPPASGGGLYTQRL